MRRALARGATRTSFIVACLLIALLSLPTGAWAGTAEESNFLSLYFTQDELEVFSATRSLKSVASVAENVTVVTAEDIELMNAHTLAEALYNVTGIEMQDFKGPGSGGAVSIEGSGANRVMVMLDGVALNTASNDFALSRLPVQMIRKIEIVKGPASSTWGSSFGGVVNVITKSAAGNGGTCGTVSVSAGEHSTSDLREELRADNGTFALYLFGGALDSDGVQADHEFTHKDFFGKLSVNAGAKSRLDAPSTTTTATA